MTSSFFSLGAVSTIGAGVISNYPVGTSGNTGVTEGTSYLTFRTAGTLSQLTVRIAANAVSGTSTVTSRQNAATANMSLSIGAGATGVFTDSVNSDSVASGDKMTYRVQAGAGGTTITLATASFQYDPSSTSETLSKLACIYTFSFSTASVTRYFGLAGLGNTSSLLSTEANAQFRTRIAGTLKNFQVGVSSNTRTATTFGTRVNGANGNCTVTVGASATGLFEDTVNTDTVSSADLLNYYLTTGTGVNSLALRNVSSELISSEGKSLLVGYDNSTTIVSGTATVYTPIASDVVNNSTEGNVQTRIPVSGAFHNSQVFIGSNAQSSGTRTITLRVNGADTSLSFTIGGSATGRFENTSNSVGVASGDQVNFKVVGGSAGAVAATILGVHFTSGVIGAGSATEGADTASASGTATVNPTGTAAATENGDTCTGSGILRVTCTGAITEASDTGTGSSTLILTGSASLTEDGDTGTGSGQLAITGTVVITESDDTGSGNGNLAIIGTASMTEDGDTFAASGQSVQNDTTGTAALVESDDTGSGSATLTITGAASATEANDTASASATQTFTGTSALSEASDTASSSGTLTVTGTATVTEENDSASGTATLTMTGAISATEDSDTASGTGTLSITGVSGVTEQGDSASASGLLVIFGSGAITESGDSFGSTSSLLIPSGQNIIFVREDPRTVYVRAEVRIRRVANDNRAIPVARQTRTFSVLTENRSIAA